MGREQRTVGDNPNEKRALHYPISALPCGYSLWEIQYLWKDGQAIPFKGDRAPWVIVTSETGERRKEPAFCIKLKEG